MRWPWAWVAWWVVWLGIGVPWRHLGPRPYWARVAWIPFQFFRAGDAFRNVVFFVPFGYLARRAGHHPLAVLAWGLAISLLTELLQVFTTERYPNATDVVMNVAGTVLGIGVAHIRSRPAHGRPGRPPGPPD
ncbi:MAG: VanZ family protein [Acidobacteria bacterium]|nr:VanZ family protein [Acidobacteriota bacterium]